MHNNRIKDALSQHRDKGPAASDAASGEVTAPGQIVSTQQLYNAAWSMAKRDWELNRLFNAWYYQI